MVRKTKTERGTAELDAAKKARAGEPVFPFPSGFNEKYREMWVTTVNSRGPDYWDEGDIPLLKMYVRNAWDMDDMTDTIEVEGNVVRNPRGTQVMNPLIVARSYCEARLLGLAAKLRLQPASRMNSDNDKKLGAKTKRAKDAARELDDGDGLLDGVDHEDTPQERDPLTGLH